MRLTPIAANQTEIETADARIFFSYSTPVAAYIFGQGFVRSEEFFSVTTSRHINKWIGVDSKSDDIKRVPQSRLESLAQLTNFQNWFIMGVLTHPHFFML